jgi:hypothetical protein
LPKQRLCPFYAQADEIGMRRHASFRGEGANHVRTGNAGRLRQVVDAYLARVHRMKILADPCHGARGHPRLASLGRKIAVTLEESPQKLADAGLPLEQGVFELG